MGKDNQGGYSCICREGRGILGNRMKDSAGILCPTVAERTIIIAFV